MANTGDEHLETNQVFQQLLPRSAAVLREMYSAGALPGAPHGEPVAIDQDTRISAHQGAELHRLVSTAGAKSCLEVGLAYGYSTVWILDALSRTPDTSHVAIDPFQLSRWGGVGLETVNRLNAATKFQWIQERSDFALASFAKAERTFDFIYIDGGHRFDDVIVDFYLSDRVLNVQGLMVFDDMFMPSIQTAVSFLERNRAYQRVASQVRNIAVLRKSQNDSRDWRHFVPFEVAAARPDAFRRMLARLRQSLFQG